MGLREAFPASVPREAPRARLCPACGDGELLALALRGSGETRRAAYCGGVYDRARRRYVKPSCGWSGPERDEGAGRAAGPDRAAAGALTAPT